MSEKLLDTIEVNDKDIILMKGNWTEEEIQGLAKVAQVRKMNNILVVVPEDKAMEVMPVDEFYYLLREVEKNREEESPLATAIKALEKLARLGNEPHYGNSTGNSIAIDCLNKIT